MTLKCYRFSTVVEIHVYAKFHQAKCSGSRVIAVTEIKLCNDAENNTAFAFTRSKNRHNHILLYNFRFEIFVESYTQIFVRQCSSNAQAVALPAYTI